MNPSLLVKDGALAGGEKIQSLTLKILVTASTTFSRSHLYKNRIVFLFCTGFHPLVINSGTYLFSSICTPWYHPIPRLGAPHPTRTTSDCPGLAYKGMVRVTKVRRAAVTVVGCCRTANPETCRRTDEENNMVVEMMIRVVAAVERIDGRRTKTDKFMFWNVGEEIFWDFERTQRQ